MSFANYIVKVYVPCIKHFEKEFDELEHRLSLMDICSLNQFLSIEFGDQFNMMYLQSTEHKKYVSFIVNCKSKHKSVDNVTTFLNYIFYNCITLTHITVQPLLVNV